MKNLAAVGFLIVGLTLGVIIGKASQPAAAQARGATETAPSHFRASRSARPDHAKSQVNGIDRIRRAKPTELASLTRLAVTTADPVENQRLLSECLLNMTAENWQEVVAAFGKISSETGRDPASEWRLALLRSGQVAGEDAMNHYLATGLDHNKDAIWSVLYGWGTKDPRAAINWLNKAAAEGHATPIATYTALIAGAALSNPKQALDLLDQLPPDHRKNCAGHLVWNVVQNSGVEALDQVLSYANALDRSNPDNAAFADSLFYEVTQKLLWKADHARDVGQACDVVVKLTRLGQDPTNTTRQVLHKYRWYSMSDKLNIVETVSTAQTGPELNYSSLVATVTGTMNGAHDVTAVRDWMKEHPDSPLIPYLSQRIPDAP